MSEECRIRARLQIQMGERLAAERGLDRSRCVDAAHHLIDDGGAARQGDDPDDVRRYGLPDLRLRALDIERMAVRAWSQQMLDAVVGKLRGYGLTRAKDVKRIMGHR